MRGNNAGICMMKKQVMRTVFFREKVAGIDQRMQNLVQLTWLAAACTDFSRVRIAGSIR